MSLSEARSFSPWCSPQWVRGCRIGPLYPPACRTRRLKGGGNLFAVGCGLCRGTRGSVAVLASSGSLASALDLGLKSSYMRGWVAWPILIGWWCLALGPPITFIRHFRLTSFIFSFPLPISFYPLVPEGDCWTGQMFLNQVCLVQQNMCCVIFNWLNGGVQHDFFTEIFWMRNANF